MDLTHLIEHMLKLQVHLLDKWEKIKSTNTKIISCLVGLVAAIIIIVVITIRADSFREWTGISGYGLKTTSQTTTQGTTQTTIQTTTTEAKTLWNFLELLIIPGVLAIVGLWFSYQSTQTEQKIASDRLRESALRQYLDQMTELLVDKNLRRSDPDNQVRSIARVRTLTVLRGLDGKRKGTLLRFLHESDLINGHLPVINLKGADLSKVDLTGATRHKSDQKGGDLLLTKWIRTSMVNANMENANLTEANLSEVDLSGAYLSGTVLIGANLSKTKLREADLHMASMQGINLSEADLTDATLTNAFLHKFNLEHPLLGEPRLRAAKLVRADLSKSTLSGANLSEADFSDAILAHADLGKTDLSKAKISDEQLRNAGNLTGAIMPNGRKYNPEKHHFG